MGNCAWCEIPEYEDYAEIPSGDPLKEVLGKRYKVLLVGSGSCGKTTFANCINQRRDRDKAQMTKYIRENCVKEMWSMLQQADEEGYQFKEEEKDIQSVNLIKQYADYGEWRGQPEAQDLGDAIYHCWCLDPVQKIFIKRFDKDSKVYTMCNIEYFFDKVQEIMTRDYVPTVQDISKCYIHTTGIRDFIYNGDGSCQLSTFDIGGQRSERPKWIHVFEGTDCIIHFCSLDQFCLNLFEDGEINALQENLNLFTDISAARYFKRENCQFIVILNKTDLFYQYLIYNSLKDYFPDYKGINYEDYDILEWIPAIINSIGEGVINIKDALDKSSIQLVSKYVGKLDIVCYSWLDSCYKDGMEFVRNKFIARNRNKKKDIKFFELCSLNQDQVNKTMSNIQREIIKFKLDFVSSMAL